MDAGKIIAAIPGMNAAQRTGLRANAERLLADPKSAAVAREVIAALDGQAAAEEEALLAHVRNLPMAKRVVEAFRHEPMTETERKLVQVLLDHPGSTSEGLSRALGWGGQAWHLHFGEMCRRREARLWPADRAEKRDSSFYSGILADLSADNRWSCKPDVAAAFGELGLRPMGSP